MSYTLFGSVLSFLKRFLNGVRRDAPVNEDTIIMIVGLLSFVLGFLVSDRIHYWNEKRKVIKRD